MLNTGKLSATSIYKLKGTGNAYIFRVIHSHFILPSLSSGLSLSGRPKTFSQGLKHLANRIQIQDQGWK